ncbi:MAG TPA: SRPBCC family protein [Nocardioidaceae bacterium]|nr:SRPBCC family protein [Nocardioidaceae bacterium]
MSTKYRFEHAWSLPARQDALFHLLADVAAYPTWWPQVRAVAGVDEDTAHVVVRSVLPYSLDLTLVRAVEDADAGVLEARIHGQLEGWSRWRLSGNGSSTRLLYEQEVTVQGRLMELGSRLARPLLVANHDAMMRGGRNGLLARVGPQARSRAVR